MGYSGFHSINQVDLRIDEDVLRLSPNPGLTRHEHNASSVFYESQKDFTVPLSLLRKILSSRDVWLRIGTNDGVIEDAIIENERDSKGFNALKRFIADVDAQQ
ncbi:hypothetical protein CBF45_07565 [Bordetella sp. J329]|nr:hypothetical protein CBF45_07565 [Bordetella sp. J329]